MAPDAVAFRLADDTFLTVSNSDLSRVYQALWGFADRKGAISTAVLLIEQARKHERYRQPVELNPRQSDVLRQAVACLANLSY